MLESIRQNLKGTLVVIVIVIFVVPLVVSGVGTAFLGSSTSTEVAEVGRESISQATLERAIRNERDRLLQQKVDPASPLLEEANLQSTVMERLTQRAALVDTARKNGMAVSEKEYSKVLANEAAFFTDGNFDSKKFQSLLAQFGLTTSGYRKEVSSDILVQQQITGVEQSAFISPHEFAQIARLTHQKRSFYGITLPAVLFRNSIDTSEEELAAHYEQNQSRYEVAEKIKVEYLDLNLDELANNTAVNEQDIRDQYDAEVEEASKSITYRVAHILVEDSDSEKVDAIASELASGTDFAELAKAKSDDFGSSDFGGDLGVMTPDTFPKEFENAVKQLDSGQVSDAVVTDAGTHFIKLIEKDSEDIPSYDSRKDAIRAEIARTSAAEDYSLLVDQLGELTFSSDGLEDAAAELNLEVKTTEYFEQGSAGTSAIAQFKKVRDAAFSDDVKVGGHNSNTIELTSERTVVIRAADIQESFVRPLEEVRNSVEASLRTVKTRELLVSKANELKERFLAGEEPKTVANELGYAFEDTTLSSRDAAALDFQTVSLAFRTAKPVDGVSFGEENKRGGDYLLVGVTEVVDGKLEDIQDGESQAIRAQLLARSSQQDLSAYIALVYDAAEVEISE